MKLLVIPVFTVVFLCGTLCQAQTKIDDDLVKAFESIQKTNVLVDFTESNSVAIKNVNSRIFRSRHGKVVALVEELRALAEYQQGLLQGFLLTQRVAYKTFWSSNQMVLRNIDLDLVKEIAEFKEVKSITLAPTVKVEPIYSSETTKDVPVQWGVAKIQADKVWENEVFGTKGEGVVVANIDTGVLGSHEALASNWRSDHGWFDPYSTNSTTPDDKNGHGTHTMGTIAGQNGIGVAPGATWISCRGCHNDSCELEQLLACGQWMLEPTNWDGSDPDSSKIPDVVSNSWGGALLRSAYNPTIEAWTAAGILSTFALGNSGPFCFSGGAPGNQAVTFSVGSTDKNDRLSIFSSKGPGSGLRTKPEVAAPGSAIYSAWYTGNDKYKTISGTSMAAPHVAGTMALMLSAYRNRDASPKANLPQEYVVSTVEMNTDTENLTLGLNIPCNFMSGYPNNQFGHGRINALKAVNATYND